MSSDASQKSIDDEDKKSECSCKHEIFLRPVIPSSP